MSEDMSSNYLSVYGKYTLYRCLVIVILFIKGIISGIFMLIYDFTAQFFPELNLTLFILDLILTVIFSAILVLSLFQMKKFEANSPNVRNHPIYMNLVLHFSFTIVGYTVYLIFYFTSDIWGFNLLIDAIAYVSVIVLYFISNSFSFLAFKHFDFIFTSKAIALEEYRVEECRSALRKIKGSIVLGQFNRILIVIFYGISLTLMLDANFMAWYYFNIVSDIIYFCLYLLIGTVSIVGLFQFGVNLKDLTQNQTPRNNTGKSSGVSYCQFCGKSYDAGINAKFCHKCGNPLLNQN